MASPHYQMSVQNLLGSIASFMEKILLVLEKDRIDVSTYLLDHICYRVETLARYVELKKSLQERNEKISENIIHGRPISVFKLKKPLVYGKWNISCLELPSPKPNSFYPEGYEHVEFVVPNLQKFSKQYSHLPFQEDLIPQNRTLSLKYDGLSIKFHEQPLERVVKIQ